MLPTCPSSRGFHSQLHGHHRRPTESTASGSCAPGDAAYVADRLFDLGITGRDWVEETGSEVVAFSGNSSTRRRPPVRSCRPGSAGGLPVVGRCPTCPAGCGSTEYPELTRRYFADPGLRRRPPSLHGATEAERPRHSRLRRRRRRDGQRPRAAGLRIIDEILVVLHRAGGQSAAYEDPAKRHAMEQVLTLLSGCWRPAARSWSKTQRGIGSARRGDRRAACHEDPDRQRALRRRRATRSRPSCRRTRSTSSFPALSDAGATDIIELPLSKIVH